PREAWTVIERGDILRVMGAPADVERAAAHVGFVERDLARTDLMFLAAGICAGILLGLVKLNAAGMVLGLGTAGSILVVGLAGGQTCTPGLNALREASGSNVGSLAYTVPYALNNIVLTIWGPVVVAIVHAMRTP